MTTTKLSRRTLCSTLGAAAIAGVVPIRAARAAESAAGAGAKPKIGIFYFTWAGSGGRVAEVIRRLNPSVTLARIERAVPYPTDYDETTAEARREAAEEVLPALNPLPVSPDAFDIVVIGHPVWSGSLPRPVVAFLKANAEALRGKRVLHYAMHGGSRLGDTDEEMQALLPGVKLEAAAFYGWGGLRDEDAVEAWVKESGFIFTS